MLNVGHRLWDGCFEDRESTTITNWCRIFLVSILEACRCTVYLDICFGGFCVTDD